MTIQAIAYTNTLTNLPGWVRTVHKEQVYGYAYETDTHFVHFYGKHPLFIISHGLTVLEGKNGTLRDWIQLRFGGKDFLTLDNPPGSTFANIWRPSLYLWQDIKAAIGVSDLEKHRQDQAIRILIAKLDEILLFLEPSTNGLLAHGHRIRELLILAATEVENQISIILNRTGTPAENKSYYTTRDYVKLAVPGRLSDFQFSLKYHSNQIFRPFFGWDPQQPTQSLAWYDAYNKTKHDREAHFGVATLEHAINAVCGNLALYCARFGPYVLLQDNTSLSSSINQTFDIEMVEVDRSAFYLPLLKLPPNTRTDCFVFDSYSTGHFDLWNTRNLVL